MRVHVAFTPDEAAAAPTGLVIDVIRATSTICQALDAGYDSEANHVYAREGHGVTSHMPPEHGRPGKGPPAGRYRRLMKQRFDEARYRRRVQVETVMSMLKRRQGAATRGRSFQARCRDLRLMAITHNVMIQAAAA